MFQSPLSFRAGRYLLGDRAAQDVGIGVPILAQPESWALRFAIRGRMAKGLEVAIKWKQQNLLGCGLGYCFISLPHHESDSNRN
jgi:hypothetical protein